MKTVAIGEFLDQACKYQNGGVIGNSIVIIECNRFVANTSRDRSPDYVTVKTPFYYPMPSKLKPFKSEIGNYSSDDYGRTCVVTIEKVNLETGILTIDEYIE